MKISITCATLALSIAVGRAATLAEYNFDGNYTASNVLAGATATSVSPNTGTVAGNSGFTRTSSSPIAGTESLVITFANLNNEAEPTGGNAAGDNITFTISTTPGQSLKLDTLSFLTALNNTQPSGAFYTVQYDLADGAGFKALTLTPATAQLNNTPVSRSVDLSGDAFSNISNGITFRINLTEPVGSTNLTNASVRLDSISLTGSIVPEPSSFAMVLGASVLGLVRRRK